MVIRRVTEQEWLRMKAQAWGEEHGRESLDGFQQWQKRNGLPVTDHVDGKEVVR